jgi:hypothetical protein
LRDKFYIHISGFIILVFVLLGYESTLFAQCKIKPSTNLVVNSDFNAEISNWTLMRGMFGCKTPPLSTISHDNNALKISINNNYDSSCPSPFNWRTYVLGSMTGTLISGQPYVFTFKVKTNSNVPVNFDAAVRLTTSQWLISFNSMDIRAINQWQEFCKIALYTGSTVSNIEVAFFFGKVADGTEIWIDDVYVGSPAGFVENHKIRINQIGNLINFPKEGLSVDSCNTFVVKDVSTNSIVYSGNCQKLGKYPFTHPNVCQYELDTIWRLDYTTLNAPGNYYIESDNGKTSYNFSIKQDIYNSLRKDAFRFFYFQRCGYALSSNHWGNLARPACHNLNKQDNNAVTVDTNFNFIDNKDVSGGWHDAGDYVKYTFNNALSTVWLAKAYLENPMAFSDNEQIPESGNGVPDIVDELIWNTYFLFKLQDTNAMSPNYGGVHSKVSTLQWNVYTLPQNESAVRFLTPPTTISTAGFVAAMCYLYRVFNTLPAYQSLATACSTAAFRGWQYLNSHTQNMLDKVNEADSGYINTATYDFYPDIDERIWAAAELFRTFQDNSAHTYFINNFDTCDSLLLDNTSYLYSYCQASSSSLCPDMSYHQHYAWIGFLSYLDAPSPDPNVLNTLNIWLFRHADTIVNRTNNYPFSFSLRTWGNNYSLLNNAMVLKKAFDITNNTNYLYALNKNLDYVLGKNITGYSFITEYGSLSPVNLNHLHTKNDGFAELPKGALVGGPPATPISPPPLPSSWLDTIDMEIKWYFDTCTAHTKRYLDFPQAPFPNEPTIDYNARLVYALYSLTPYTSTGINNDSFYQKEIIVYPNPNNGIFNIKCNYNSLEKYDIDICDMLGQRTYYANGVNINTQTKINVSGMPSGLYLIIIRSRGESYFQIVIIQK